MPAGRVPVERVKITSRTASDKPTTYDVLTADRLTYYPALPPNGRPGDRF